MLGYSDNELANMGGYDLVHFDDLAYVASAHSERKYTERQKAIFLNNAYRETKLRVALAIAP